jgi:N6-L-threonylcarbamoyladenine synthase
MVVAGGVSANLVMRSTLDELSKELGCRIYYPSLKLCTDNGAMIAYAGYERLKSGHTEALPIVVRPRWPMTELSTTDTGRDTTNG